MNKVVKPAGQLMEELLSKRKYTRTEFSSKDIEARLSPEIVQAIAEPNTRIEYDPLTNRMLVNGHGVFYKATKFDHLWMEVPRPELARRYESPDLERRFQAWYREIGPGEIVEIVDKNPSPFPYLLRATFRDGVMLDFWKSVTAECTSAFDLSDYKGRPVEKALPELLQWV